MKVLRLASSLITAGLLLVAPGTAQAGVEDWELSELYRGSDPELRFVELVNLVGGCLFPSSALDLFDAQGGLIATMSVTVSTACHGAPTYMLFATAEAAASFGVARDRNLSSELPSSGQLCFRSSATYYDCVRWGSVSDPVVDLFGPQDLSAAMPPADGLSLARTKTTHVVIDDFSPSEASPRQPNDGTSWQAPDGGFSPDAGSSTDAGPRPDAGRRRDAGQSVTGDAGDPRYLDLDTVGGASCGCQSAEPVRSSSLFFVIAALFWTRRRSQLARLLESHKEG